MTYKYQYPCAHNFIPPMTSAGYFGAQRKYDIHTGIDIYTYEGATVYSLTNGKIVYIGPFTGQKVNSPWWNDTECIMIDNGNTIINYGEIIVNKHLKVGDIVNEKDVLGKVTRVLKKDKGLPTTMLHIEHYHG